MFSSFFARDGSQPGQDGFDIFAARCEAVSFVFKHIPDALRPRSAINKLPNISASVRDSPSAALLSFSVESDWFMVSLHRIEPNNMILTVVEAFSRVRRDFKFVSLANCRTTTPNTLAFARRRAAE